MMNESQIEQWVFRKDLDSARKDIQARLDAEVNRADRKYHLVMGQKKKLEVAGRGDMKRLFDRFEELRKRVRRSPIPFNMNDPGYRELQSLEKACKADLFGDDSMLAKTLKRILTPEQVAAHEKDVYRSKVDLILAILDRAIALNEDQHRRLVTAIVEESPPLLRYGSFNYDAVMLQASRLPRDRIRPILDAEQLGKILVRFEQAKRMEKILIAEGYVLSRATAPERSVSPKDDSKPTVSDARSK